MKRCWREGKREGEREREWGGGGRETSKFISNTFYHLLETFHL